MNGPRTGNHTTALYWEYDTRTARRANIDPKFKKLPSISPFATNNNTPIWSKDPEGDIALIDNLIGGIIGAGVDYIS